MKKVLAVVIAVAFISIGAVSSDAQVPNISIYFDDLLQNQQGECQGLGVQDTLYVVCNNFNTFLSTVEFATQVNFPLIYLGDVHNAGALFLGTSTTGVTITYPIPQAAFGPFIAMRLRVLWQCDDCDLESIPPTPLAIVPHPGTGNIEGVAWQTFEVIPAVGMTSLVCPGIVSTEESSWGRVKALYNN